MRIVISAIIFAFLYFALGAISTTLCGETPLFHLSWRFFIAVFLGIYTFKHTK